MYRKIKYLRSLSACVLMVSFITSYCIAEFSSSDAGTCGAQFLKIGTSASSSGMGEAQGAVCSGANALNSNPAGLGKTKNTVVALSHGMWLDDISVENFAYVQPVKKGSFAIGLTYLYMNDIQKYDYLGSKVEGQVIKPADMLGVIGYGISGSRLSAGINLKYIASRLDETTAEAYGADLGFLFKITKKISVGIAGQNIGTTIKYDKEETSLPVNTKVSAGYMTQTASFDIDVNIPKDNEIAYCAGIEFTKNINKKLCIMPRAGYRSNTKGLNNLACLSMGLGINIDCYIIDYGWVPFGELGDTHKMSLSIKF
jgi:hypothetical protein